MNGTMNRMMNGTMKEMMNVRTPIMTSTAATNSTSAPCEAAQPALISETCHASSFSLAAFAGSVLLCLGILVYAILTA